MKKIVLAGVDVSAKELVVALDRGNGRVWTAAFANDASGHRKLAGVLTKRNAQARVCVEATGIYHLELSLALHRAPRTQLMVANPRATKDFARAPTTRASTSRCPRCRVIQSPGPKA